MDEPTAALAANETLALHEIVRSLARSGKTILLISHFLREVLELANSVTVLRDGQLVRTSPTAEETESSLVEAMLGRSLTATFPEKLVRDEAETPVLMSVRDVSAPGVSGVSFDLRAGEILGIAGLVGVGPHGARARALRREQARVGDGRARDGRALRPQPTPQPRRRARAHPRVAQGRRARLRPLVDRERDALAAAVVERARSRSARTRTEGGAPRARALRRARLRDSPRRSARSPAATSRRCFSPGRSSAARAC